MRLATLALGAVLGPMVLGGCLVDDDLFDVDDGPDIVAVVPRSQIALVDDAFDAGKYATSGGVVGEVLAVCGYEFNRVASANRVVIDGFDCDVFNYFEIDGSNRFGALFFRVPSEVPVGNQRRLNVLVSGESSDRRPYFDVHRLAYASPTSGTSVVASDLSINKPAWVTAYDWSATANPDTMVLSPCGGFAYVTSGPDLYLVQVADGQAVISATGFFNGGVGPLAISPDGKTLVAGVIPAAPNPPELAVVDTTFVEKLAISVNPANGVITVLDQGNAPAFTTPATVSLGGAFPGRMVFDSASAAMYLTMSSAVVREYSVSGTTLTQVQDFSVAGTAPFGIAIAPDDSRLLVSDISANNQVIPIDLTAGTVGTALAAGTTPLTPLFTTDGARAVVVNVGGTDYSLYDVSGSGVAAHAPATLSLGNPPGEIALSPDGPIGLVGSNNIIACVNGNQLNFITYDASTGGLALAGWTTGPFANPLKLVAVTPKR